MRRTALFVVSLLALTGCSSVIDRTYQIVTFNTPGVTGADCDAKTRYNHYRFVTPAKVQVDRSDDTLDITCIKPLYYTVHARVPSKYELNHSLLNIFNGLIPGMAYDTASKANFEYPHEINIGMTLDPAAVEAARDAGGQDVPPPQKKTFDAPAEEEIEIDLKPADQTMSKTLRK